MRRSRVLIVCFILSFVLSGLVEGYFRHPDDGAAAFGHALVIAVICFAGCRADVMERGIAAPPGSAILCGVLPVIGVPVHFFRTRPMRHAAVATAKAAAILAVSLVLYSLALWMVEYVRS